jgi:hypothetical protein
MGLIWELDYYSRPILEESGKKRWEVVLCQALQSAADAPAEAFRFSEYCPANEVNSLWLEGAIQRAIAQAGYAPDRIRFFRRQMKNMITKSCKDLGISSALTRRTVLLNHWLQQRYAEVYPQEPGYQASSNSSVQYGPEAAQSLPDALRGDQWGFVSLAAADFADLPEWEVGFGESFPISLLQLQPQQPIPGLLIYSNRAMPLAAWMSGLELDFLKYDATAQQLVLETGGGDRWIVAPLPQSALQAEAGVFEIAKQTAQGVHFIGIQTDPQAEAFEGFWLLQELDVA